MIVGMDFGTTNSGIATYDGKSVSVLPLDPANTYSRIARTAIYITNNQQVALGREAINRYFEENSGRPVKMKRVWVGEFEVYGADMYYVTDAYAWVDSLSPGRLFLSIKSGLHDPEYQGTVIGRYYYSLENLIAIYMNMLRLRSQRLLGQEINEVVLGRPVHFSMDPQEDSLAQQRLLESAFRAGFDKVYFQYEPVAAAYNYATTINQPQNILVFDFGGGTLDLTVMHLDGKEERKVLATGGIPIAGDIFDQRLVRARFPKHFGEGTLYGEKHRRLPMPKWIYDVFSDWKKVFELQTIENRRRLRDIAQTADDRRGVEALISLVSNNYSLQMFDLVEAAKRKLSEDMGTVIRFDTPDFKVTEMVTRSEFEKIIRPEIVTIEQHLDDTLAASGLRPVDIDAVIRTGGSSTIPAFRYMLVEKFGKDKVMATDTFSSVVSGLGIIAHGIKNGSLDGTAHTPGDRPVVKQDTNRQQVTAINLTLLKRRLAAQEDPQSDRQPSQDSNLVLLDSNGDITVNVLDAEFSGEREIEDLPLTLPPEGTPHLASFATATEPLLLVSSRYRFFLVTVRDLLEMVDINMVLKTYLLLQPGEHISAIAKWAGIIAQSKLILVTSFGYIRSYPLNGMIEEIEGPSPYQFDQPLPGLPTAVFGAESSDCVIVFLDSGRAVRFSEADIPQIGVQAINRGLGEHISGALPVGSTEELAVITENGFGRCLPANWVPVPSKPNTRGRVMVSRRPVAGISPVLVDEKIWALSNRRLVPIAASHFRQDDTFSTTTRRLFKIAPGERILLLPSP